MESTCRHGCIQISQATYDLVQHATFVPTGGSLVLSAGAYVLFKTPVVVNGSWSQLGVLFPCTRGLLQAVFAPLCVCHSYQGTAMHSRAAAPLHAHMPG